MRKANVNVLPFSWTVKTWPADVYPFTSDKARYLIRAYRSQLLRASALTRIGREVIIFGDGYERWLKSNAGRVESFEVSANAPQHIHKRFGKYNETQT